MRKSYLFALVSISFFSLAQEISEDYLNSLPEDIREDVMNRVEEKNGLEEEVYRSINSSSDVEKKDFDDPIFGADFFDTMQTSFMPVNLPNLDDDYVLDNGDVLSIQLLGGQKDSTDSYQISRDGSINLPDIGKLQLSGLALAEASKIIISKVKQAYIGVDAYITLEKIRDVNILVSGNAYNPGVYTLNGNSNMLHALHASGGISEQGSYRNIKLIRDNKVIETLDIYDILIMGNFNLKTRLKSGDMIFVDSRLNVVTLEGAFKRPAKYELFKDQNLFDVILYANGVTSSADFSNIFLYRLLDGEIRDIPITNISQFEKIQSNDLDRIFIREYSFRDVEISGAILRPGNYKMKEGDNIFDLIERAGGYTQNAFPEGAIYLNEDAEQINKNALDKLYNDFIDSLLEVIQKSSTGDSNFQSLVAISNELRDSEPNGRIIIDLKDDSIKNLVRNNDKVYIPEKNNNIFIYGEVLNEGPLLFKDGADLSYYLDEASGLKDSALSDAIYILYPNGRTKQFSRKRNLFAAQPQDVIIEPGSVIYVPRKIDSTISSRLTAQAYATILGNISIALASISSINNR
jgi:protein involved in polysaccharide export with SLBB domain